MWSGQGASSAALGLLILGVITYRTSAASLNQVVGADASDGGSQAPSAAAARAAGGRVTLLDGAPEMVRLPPVAWVISTRRGWLRGDAGMVTCRTPSA